jgi:hypothetical protein
MITCPNCSKQNADEAAHCGFCGHQLSAGNKPLKTMFGMNALDPELLKQALETKAPAAAPPADPEPVEPGPPMPTSIPKLNLPKPGGLPPLGGLRAPASDAFGATEAMPAVTAPNAAVPGAPDPFVDEFAALEAQFGHEFAPSTPPSDEDDSGAPTEMHDTSALLDEQAGPRETPMFNMGAKPAGDPFAPPGNAPGGAPRGNLPAPMPGGGQVAKKSNTPIFIAVGVLLFMMLLGCAGLGAVFIFAG